jgi:hypothetical protein
MARLLIEKRVVISGLGLAAGHQSTRRLDLRCRRTQVVEQLRFKDGVVILFELLGGKSGL